jgi:hypothetical protein
MLFREIIAVYPENHAESIKAVGNAELLNVNTDGTYS